MNHKLWATVGARVIAATFLISGLAACGERLSDTSSKSPTPSAASPSAVVIGQAPAEPTPEPAGVSATPQTTPPVGARGEVSAVGESVDRPKEGDTNSHSTLKPNVPQKAEGASAINMERKAP